MVGNAGSDYNPVCAVVLEGVIVGIADGRRATDSGGSGDGRACTFGNQGLNDGCDL